MSFRIRSLRLRVPRHSHLRRLLFLALAFVLFTSLYQSLYHWITSSSSRRHPPHVLVGVFSRPEDVEMRSIIRSTYARFRQGRHVGSTSITRRLLNHVDVKFVLGQPFNDTRTRWNVATSSSSSLAMEGDQGEEMEAWNKLVKWEQDRFDDVIVIDMPENKDRGKTPKYFVWVDKNMPEYDYVMKTDLHTFVNLPALATILSKSPRSLLYMGRSINRFMSGTGYILSRDLVHFIRKFSTAQEVGLEGVEDGLIGRWLDAGGMPITRANLGEQVMDRPGYGGPWGLKTYERTPEGQELVMVHQVKGQRAWMDAAKYFIDGDVRST